ncbi:MAG TPA: adenylate/guanylate cyclase domain-containing protein [Thermoanaerobaculia bacterium]|nr:adenylate/guanylate cyclase domain-containing protein [Thermoanaerobaculia bacterium]
MAIKLVAATGSPSVLVTGGRSFLVGRSASCDLPVQDPTVSRRHAELELVGPGVRVKDLGSTNGTYLDGVRVIDALATPGSRVAFGKVDFEVVAEQPEAPAAPEELMGEGSLDATILRQMPVRGRADIASQLAEGPRGGASLLKIGGDSLEDRQARKLNLLLDIVKELSQQTEVDRLLDRVVGLTFQVMEVDRVAVMTAEDGEELVPRIWRSRVETSAGSWRVPRAIARKAVEDRVAVLSENVPEDDRFAEGAAGHHVQSALCAPLLGSQGTVLGIIYLDHLGNAHTFTEEDLEFFTAFAGMAAVAIENSRLIDRMRREAVVLSNFQRYFAPDLARQIAGQEEEIKLGGSKRRVVVLFSDIRGFTSISERMSPDEIARLLTDYFTEMVEVVFEYGGTLDKFMGDAMMALWGAPLAHADDPDRAVRAAMAMQRKLSRLNAQWREQGRPSLSIGIGINLGEVFAGNIGSVRRLEYTVIGDAVNIAARLCSEAAPGEILIAEPLFAGLRLRPPASSLTPLPLRGKAQPVGVYSVDWEEGKTAQ